LFAVMSNERAETATELDYSQRLVRVLVHVHEHLDDPLPLDDLAAIAHFSPFHFHRIFSGMIGESVAQHVRRLRLERAALRLQHTQQPITHIAFDAGYENHESFTRAFKNAFDRTPSAYRAELRSTPCIAAPTDTHFVVERAPRSFSPVQHNDKERHDHCDPCDAGAARCVYSSHRAVHARRLRLAEADAVGRAKGVAWSEHDVVRAGVG
jgi:AraC-like DNA-binding protein